MKTKFVKETDRKGTYIIEGSFDGTFFNIKRFICQVQKQETEKETQKLADFQFKYNLIWHTLIQPKKCLTVHWNGLFACQK